MTLAEFLAARLDEDEATAKAAGPVVEDSSGPHSEFRPVDLGEWHVNIEGNITGPFGGHIATGPYGGGLDEAQAAHIARHDPARVLAEVRVWRRLLLEHQTKGLDAKYAGTERETGFHLALSLALKSKAMTYSSHPDYREDLT